MKLSKDSTLDGIISSAGYYLDDAEVYLFLNEFIRLNTAVKSISLLKKGTVIRLPLSHLRRAEGHKEEKNVLPVAHRVREKIIRKAELKNRTVPVHSPEGKTEMKKSPVSVATFDRAGILGTVKTLYRSLEDDFAIDNDGLKIFNVGDRSDLSLDKSFFPLINVHHEQTLIFDYTGILSDNLKDLIEISWPEYKIVSYKEGMDLKRIIYTLLSESGYSVHKSEKFVVGGEDRMEYYPDFLVFRKNNDIIDSEVSFVSVIERNENRSPASLLDWLRKKDIRVIELSNFEMPKQSEQKTTRCTVINDVVPNESFAENMLALLGYDFTRNETIALSQRKEFTFNLKADLRVNSVAGIKVIEFTEISMPEMRYAKSEGLDISTISPSDEKSEVTRKIVKLLALEDIETPDKTSKYITPKGVRYRLLLPGIFTRSRKGDFFLTDSLLDIAFLDGLVDERIAIVKF